MQKFTEPHAFTITLNPKMYRLKPVNQLKLAFHGTLLPETLRSMGDVYMTYELTKDCNIHFHGIIFFARDKIKKDVFITWYNKMRVFKKGAVIGFTDLRVITDTEGWVKYIQKDLATTSARIDADRENPIMQFKEIHKISCCLQEPIDNGDSEDECFSEGSESNTKATP